MWPPSRENTEAYVNSVVATLEKTGIQRELLGWYAVAFHLAVAIVVVGIILFKEVDDYYLLCILPIVFVIYSNFYFQGCVATRLEKKLFDNPEWYGPLTLLRLLGFEINKKTANFLVSVGTFLPLSLYILARLWNADRKTEFWIALLLLSPVAFITH